MLVRFVGCAACTTILDGDIAQDLLNMRATARPGRLVASSARDFLTHRHDGIHPVADPNPFRLFAHCYPRQTKINSTQAYWVSVQLLRRETSVAQVEIVKDRGAASLGDPEGSWTGRSTSCRSAHRADRSQGTRQGDGDVRSSPNRLVLYSDHDHQFVIVVNDGKRVAAQTVDDPGSRARVAVTFSETRLSRTIATWKPSVMTCKLNTPPSTRWWPISPRRCGPRPPLPKVGT